MLNRFRPEVRAILARYRVTNPRVFGSVASGKDTVGSDMDILIDPTQETTLFDIGAMRLELRELLGVPVDVVTPNALPVTFRQRVLSEATSI